MLNIKVALKQRGTVALKQHGLTFDYGHFMKWQTCSFEHFCLNVLLFSPSIFLQWKSVIMTAFYECCFQATRAETNWNFVYFSACHSALWSSRVVVEAEPGGGALMCKLSLSERQWSRINSGEPNLSPTEPKWAKSESRWPPMSSKWPCWALLSSVSKI